MNALPSPTVLSTQIQPPCASTKPFAIDSPRPEPETREIRAVLLRQKLSNTVFSLDIWMSGFYRQHQHELPAHRRK